MAGRLVTASVVALECDADEMARPVIVRMTRATRNIESVVSVMGNSEAALRPRTCVRTVPTWASSHRFLANVSLLVECESKFDSRRPSIAKMKQ